MPETKHTFEMIEAENAWDMSQTRILYESDVPFIEKKPFRLFIDKRKKDILEVKVFKDEKGLFSAFVISLIYADIVMIDFFEVMAEYKGTGVEEFALENIKDILPGARVVITGRKEDDLRVPYYEKCGYVKKDYGIKMGEVKLDVYTLPEDYNDVAFDELVKVYEHVYGPMISSVLELDK